MKKIFIMMLVLSPLLFAGNGRGEIDSINAIPHDYIMSNLDISIQKFSENLIKAKAAGYRAGEARAFARLGMAYNLRGKYDIATSYYLNAAEIFDELGLSEELAEVYGDFAYHLKRSDLARANYYMRLAISIAEENELIVPLAKLYDNFGVIKELETKYDSANIFYLKALAIKEELKDSVGLPYSLNHLAGISARNGELEEALGYMRRSDAIRANKGGEYGRAENVIILADIFNSASRGDSAIYYYNKALEMAKDLHHNYMIRYIYEQLTEIYKQRGDYKKAYNYFKSYSDIKDTVLNDEVQVQIEKLKINYETEKKDRLLAQNQLELSRRDLMLYLALGIVLILIVFAYWIYRTQKLKREKIRAELEFREKLNKAELEQKITGEKLRISRDLHDNIGSQLTFMISSLDNLSYKLNDENTLNKVSYLGNFGRNTLSDLRNTIWALKQEKGGMEQFILKIKELAVSINNNVELIDILVTAENIDLLELSANMMLNMYRVVQEAVQNAMKHSGCTKIEIIVATEDGIVKIIVRDNGRGFDKKDEKYGSGLENMEQRCKETGGSLSIVSNEMGTELFCSFRVNKADAV